MKAIADYISLKLTHFIDKNGEYNAFTSVEVDIMLNERKIGHITATLVDRQLIPKGDFFSTMDGYSGDLQWIASTAFEQKYGRTVLQSLAKHDDPKFLIMYIDKLHLDPEFKQDSDIAASALRKLLHHPFIKGTNELQGIWKVSCAFYILDSLEQMTPLQAEDTHKRHEADAQRQEEHAFSNSIIGALETQSRRMHREDIQQASEQHYEDLLHTLARTDASAFLRAGFFQDPSIARLGGNSGNLLMATHADWSAPALLSTHAQAQAVIFTNQLPNLGAPVGHDAAILLLVKTTADKTRTDSLASTLVASTTIFARAATNAQDMTNFRLELIRLIGQGGSVSRSLALHEACANNDLQIVRIILDVDSSCINDSDAGYRTPLMVAVMNIAGRQSMNGLHGDTEVIDLLLGEGAQKDTLGANGMTAYGTFKHSADAHATLTMALTGRAAQGGDLGVQMMALKLMPSRGPTPADSSDGEQQVGFVNYFAEDRKHNRDMGYPSSSDDCGLYYFEDRKQAREVIPSSNEGSDTDGEDQTRKRTFLN
jgi:hypothetical protein